jgi:hypothetical protein
MLKSAATCIALTVVPGETGDRPEGPTVNRPDRKVGITQLSEMSAKGAALKGMFTPSPTPSALGRILDN